MIASDSIRKPMVYAAWTSPPRWPARIMNRNTIELRATMWSAGCHAKPRSSRSAAGSGARCRRWSWIRLLGRSSAATSSPAPQTPPSPAPNASPAMPQSGAPQFPKPKAHSPASAIGVTTKLASIGVVASPAPFSTAVPICVTIAAARNGNATWTYAVPSSITSGSCATSDTSGRAANADTAMHTSQMTPPTRKAWPAVCSAAASSRAPMRRAIHICVDVESPSRNRNTIWRSVWFVAPAAATAPGPSRPSSARSSIWNSPNAPIEVRIAGIDSASSEVVRLPCV